MSTLTAARSTATMPDETVRGDTAIARIPRWLDAAVVTFACALFFGLCVYHLDLPGLYNDEAFDVIPGMQLLLGHPVELQRGAALHLLGLSLPLMSSSDYQGVTSTYLSIPFLAVGGINVISLRMMSIVVGILGIVLAYFLAREWFGRVEAWLTVLMLATSPGWVFWSRLGVYVVSEVVPIGAGALLAFTLWLKHGRQTDRNRALYTGMFLLGLGITTKLLFIWFINACILCVLVLYGRQLWETRRTWPASSRRWLRIAFWSVAWFCVGAFPFLLYNIQTKGTLNLIRGSLSNLHQTSNGVNNTAFLRNLWAEADSLKVVLDGGYFWFQGVAAHVYSNPLTPTVFAVAAFGLVALLTPRRNKGEAAGGGLLSAGVLLTALATLLSLALTLGVLAGQIQSTAILATIAVGLTAISVLVIAALRGSTVAMWVLMCQTAILGAAWWFGGAGRPETPAPGGPLGLWPVDAAGVLFWLGGAGAAVALGAGRDTSRRLRAGLAALVLTGAIVAQSAVTISGLWPTHLVMLLPLPQIIIAAFLVTAGRRLSARFSHIQWRRALLVLPTALVLGAVLVLDLVVDYSYHRDLNITGGGSTFSDTIYSLSQYLEAQPGRPKVVAMDWGFKRPVQFLTEERVNPLEAYGFSVEPTPEFYTGLRDLLKDPQTIYLFHDPQGTAYHRLDAFQQEAATEGKQVILTKTFNHRDGAPVYLLYNVK